MNEWDLCTTSDELKEKIWTKNRSFSGDVWFRFRHKLTAVIGLIIIILMIIFSFIAPHFTKFKYDEQNLAFSNIPFRMHVTKINNRYYYLSSNLKIIEVSEDGKLIQSLSLKEENGMKKTMTFTDGTNDIYISYLKKPATFVDNQGKKITAVEKKWNKTFLLGSDFLGRDMLTRLMYGSRISLIVALIATIVNMTIGILYGGISGYKGGLTDSVMMRIVDIISTIPLTLYVILIMVVLNNGFLSIIIALSSVYWVSMARIVRGQIMSLKESEFVYAARTIGSSSKTILFKHLLPNAMGPILVTATMLIPSAIFIEAFLGFIGLGIAPPMASLGTMCNDSLQTLRTAPYQLFLPSLLICITMFGFSYVGDGLRDALDPKLKK